MIKLQKINKIYNKNILIDTEKTDVIYAADIEIAKDIIKNTDLKYVKNPRGVSVFESITSGLIKKDKNNYISYYKDINFNTCKEYGNF